MEEEARERASERGMREEGGSEGGEWRRVDEYLLVKFLVRLPEPSSSSAPARISKLRICAFSSSCILKVRLPSSRSTERVWNSSACRFGAWGTTD